MTPTQALTLAREALADAALTWPQVPLAERFKSAIAAIETALSAAPAAPAAPVVSQQLTTAAPAGEPVAPIHGPADLAEYMRKHLKRERAALDGFVAIGNELARAAKYDRWIAALAAPVPAEPAPTWQPIETAPKDGRAILAYAARSITTVQWNESLNSWQLCEIGSWSEDGDWHPTLWRELPAAPTAPKG